MAMLSTQSSPLVRYPVAIAILAGGVYLERLIPGIQPFYKIVYLALAGIFAWELALGVMVAIGILLVFKLLGQLPIGVTIVILFLAMMFFGL